MAKTINIKIVLPEDSEILQQQLFFNGIEQMFIRWGNINARLITEKDRHAYYKICDAFEVVIKESRETVVLEDEWFGLLKTWKKNCGIVPDNINCFRQIEEAIDEVPNR